MNSELANYIKDEGLDEIIDFSKSEEFEEGTFDAVSGKLDVAFPPDPDDLVRLHKLIRTRMSFTVLEFGLGFSSYVIADALKKNEADWNRLSNKPEIRNRFMFQVFCVDPSWRWIEDVKNNFPAVLQPYVNFHFSQVEMGTFNGQICHYFTNLPDIIADFYYLDGPHPKDVHGSVNGLSFQCDERTVMAADLLLMESTFLPGTFILVDGRTNNARFLKNNFKREYIYERDKKGDVSTFELNEERLGKYNILGKDYFN